MSTDKLKPGTKVFQNRQERWKHNSLFGHVRMSSMQMKAIIRSNTTTAEAKSLAVKIIEMLDLLSDKLKVRVDSDVNDKHCF